jgi:hypothetical protein
MAVRSSALRWLLAVPVALLLLYTMLCLGLYLASARHLPDRLEPTAWRATPQLRAQFLQVEAGMMPGDTVPRLDPLTVVPRLIHHIDPDRPDDAFVRGWRLLSSAARQRSPAHLRVRNMSRHGIQIALAIRLSREWTTEQIADTLLAESFYGRCSAGIAQAAQAYYGLPAMQLRPQETLALIALLKGPSGYDLDRNPERFRKRYARLAEQLGHHGPDWSADAALARLTPPACIGTGRR